jgi:hypothetical protein
VQTGLLVGLDQLSNPQQRTWLRMRSTSTCFQANSAWETDWKWESRSR